MVWYLGSLICVCVCVTPCVSVGRLSKVPNAGGGHRFLSQKRGMLGGVTIFVGSATRAPGPTPISQPRRDRTTPDNDPCTPDFEDFARWDGVRARMRARMAAYVGDAVLIAL